jgi:hypothetical protein
MEDYLIKLRPVVFLIGINDVGAGNLGGTDKQPGHYLRDMAGLLVQRSLFMEQNLYHYLIARVRGCATEINLRGHPRPPFKPLSSRLYKIIGPTLSFFAQRLEKLVQISRAHGIEPVLITQPTLYGPG